MPKASNAPSPPYENFWRLNKDRAAPGSAPPGNADVSSAGVERPPPRGRLVRSCRGLEGCGLGPIMKSGVSDPRRQKTRIRNNDPGGQAATVAGYAGPGFHTWPGSADVLVGEYETAASHPVLCLKNVRRRNRGQRPTATEDPYTKPRHRRPSRHCSRGRWPRFPHLAARPHRSNAKSKSKTPSSHLPTTVQPRILQYWRR